MTFLPVMSDVNFCPQLDVCLVLPFLWVSLISAVCPSGSVWPGSRVCRAWWGRRWTTSCRPSSGSRSTWTNWSHPCCSTCRTAKTWTGTPHAKAATRSPQTEISLPCVVFPWLIILCPEYGTGAMAVSQANVWFSEVRAVLFQRWPFFNGPHSNTQKLPINYTCWAAAFLSRQSAK